MTKINNNKTKTIIKTRILDQTDDRLSKMKVRKIEFQNKTVKIM